MNEGKTTENKTALKIEDIPARYSLDEAAAKLGVHKRTVLYYIKQGKLKSVKICGRRLIDEQEVLRMLQGK